MSTLVQAAKVASCVGLVVAVGTAYVLVHESRRRSKKERKVAAGAASAESSALTVERLLMILTESANAAYQLIEQVTYTQLIATLPDASRVSAQPCRLCVLPPLALVDALRTWCPCQSARTHARTHTHTRSTTPPSCSQLPSGAARAASRTSPALLALASPAML